LSSSNELEKDIFEFQLAVLESVAVVLEKEPSPFHLESKAFLALEVFKNVEDRWNRICQNPAISKQLNKVISLERTGSMPVGSKYLLGLTLVEDILDRQVSGLPGLTWHIDNNLGSDFAALFLRDEVPLVTRAPIYGLLLTSGETITLEEGVNLIPPHLPSHEFDFLTAHLPDPYRPSPTIVFEHKWHEKKTLVERSRERSSYGPTEEDTTFYRIVLVLRLLGLRNFGAPYVKNGLLAPGFAIGYKQYGFNLSSSSKCITALDKLDEKEYAGLLQAWKVLRQVLPVTEDDRTKWFAIALKKMNTACQRDNSLDELLDLCVSLEALLTREPQQVTYQFKQRGTFLLSLACAYLSEGQLRAIRKFLGDAYDMRSRLVHGEPPDIIGVEETNAGLFELARIFSLKSIALSSHLIKDEIISRIDLGMANNKTRKDLEEMLQASDLAPFWNAPYEKVTKLFQDMPVDCFSSESRELT